MKRLLLAILVVFLLAVRISYTVSYFALENATMRYNLSYDNQSFSYADNSLTNDKCWIKLCGSELTGKSMLVYTGGNTSQFTQIDNLGRAITLDGGNCFNFSADISSLRAIYPGRIGIITGTDYSFATTDTVHWTNEYALGNFTIARNDSDTDVTVRVYNITNNTQYEIADNQSMIVVTLIREDTKAVLDSDTTAKNVSVDLSKQLYAGDTSFLVNGIEVITGVSYYSSNLASLSFSDILNRLPSLFRYQTDQLIFLWSQTKMQLFYKFFMDSSSIFDIFERLISMNIFKANSLIFIDMPSRMLDKIILLSSQFSMNGVVSILYRFSRFFTDSIIFAMVQYRVGSFTNNFADLITINSIYSKLRIIPDRLLADSFSISSIYSRIINLNRLYSNQFTILDIFSKSQLFRPFESATSISISDAFSRIISLNRLYPSLLSISSIYSKFIIFPDRLLADSFSISSIYSKLININRLYTNIFTISSVYSKLRIIPDQLFSNIFSLTSVSTRILDLSRPFSNTLAFSSTLSTIFTRITEFTNSLTFSGIYSRIINLNRLYSNQFTILDIFSKSQIFNPLKIINLLSVSDLYSRVINLNRFYSDLFSISDVYQLSLNIQRQFSYDITIIDALSRISTKITSMSDILTMTGIQSRMIDIIRPFTDTMTIISNVFKFQEFWNSISNSLSIIDTISRIINLNRFSSELLLLSDIFSKSQFFRPFEFATSISILDAFSRVISLNRLYTEILSLSSLYSNQLFKPLELSDLFTITGIQSRMIDLTRPFIDIFSLLSSQARSIDILKLFSDVFGFLDVRGILKGQELLQSVSDAIGISDIYIRIVDLSRQFSDASSIIGIMTGIPTKLKIFVDNIILIDVNTKFVYLTRQFSDITNIMDALTNIPTRLMEFSSSFSIDFTVLLNRISFAIGPSGGGEGTIGGGPEVEYVRYVKPEITYACISDQECITILNNNAARCMRQFCYIREYVTPPWLYPNQGAIILLILFLVFIVYDKKGQIRRYLIREKILEDKKKEFYRTEGKDIEKSKEVKEFNADVGGKNYKIEKARTKPVEFRKKRKLRTKKYNASLP